MPLTVEQMKTMSKEDLIGTVHALQLIRTNYEEEFNVKMFLNKDQVKLAKKVTEDLEQEA